MSRATKGGAYVVLASLSFMIGRHRPAPSVAEAASRVRATAPLQTRRFAALAKRLAQTAPRNESEARVLATVEPSAEIGAAWRQRLDQQYQTLVARHAPPLSEEKREAMFALNERVMRQHRQSRAAFLLGQISEPAYIEALRRSVYDNVEAAERFLTPAELRIYYDLEPGGDFFTAADRPSSRGALSQVQYAECKAKQAMP